MTPSGDKEERYRGVALPSLPAFTPAGFPQLVRPARPIPMVIAVESGSGVPSALPAPRETSPMKRSASFVLLIAVFGMSSGCSIIDRLFLANFDGPYAHQARHAGGGACQDGACQDGACQDGACESGACQGGVCPTGGCKSGACQGGDCEDGACHKRHVGRYGGLAKHHLSPEEKAALEASDYGATGPAGPPTGAVAYPYYTTRGPRDFLAKCPPSIGP